MNCMKGSTRQRGIFALALVLMLVLSLNPVRVSASSGSGMATPVTMPLTVTQNFTTTGTAPAVSTLQVTYTLTPTGDNADQAPMPDGTENGAYTFTLQGSNVSQDIKITYNQEGTYTYELKAVNEGAANYVYDTKVYQLNVETTDKDGTLDLVYYANNPDGTKAPALTFNNQYKGSTSSSSGGDTGGGGGDSGGGDSGGDSDATATPVPTTTTGTTNDVIPQTEETDEEEENLTDTDTGAEIQEAEGELPGGEEEVQAGENEGQDGKRDIWGKLLWCLLLLLLLLLLLILSQLFGIAFVDGAAMLPALGAGFFIIFAKTSRDYRRGDVVVLKQEEYGRLVRRIVGMPGETVRIDSYTGQVLINEQPLEEPYITGKTSCKEHDFCQIVLGENEYFVMGDNREHCTDSRNFGAVEESILKGRAITGKHHKFDW